MVLSGLRTHIDADGVSLGAELVAFDVIVDASVAEDGVAPVLAADGMRRLAAVRAPERPAFRRRASLRPRQRLPYRTSRGDRTRCTKADTFAAAVVQLMLRGWPRGLS